MIPKTANSRRDSSPSLSPQPLPVCRDAPSTVTVDYIDIEHLDECLIGYEDRILAVITYGSTFKPKTSLRAPLISLNLTPLDHPPLAEVWRSRRPLHFDATNDIVSAHNGSVMFGSLTMQEQDSSSVDSTALLAYQKILTVSHSLGYSHLLRMWNYFPNINGFQQGLERYQRFCVGRHHAFSEHALPFHRLLPAGTAVGSQEGPLYINFLASTQEGIHFENPRQMSAYHYPSSYGPCSPSFSRATLESTTSPGHLFIAGTASIVGHASQHPGHPIAQTKEIFNNLKSLLDHVEKTRSLQSHDLRGRTLLKVYLRHPEHLPDVRKELERSTVGLHVKPMFLRGDLCRPELLVEIESIFDLTTDYS